MELLDFCCRAVFCIGPDVFFGTVILHGLDLGKAEISKFMDGRNVLSRSADCRLPIESYYKLIIGEKTQLQKAEVWRIIT
jgi:hypothetical protein